MHETTPPIPVPHELAQTLTRFFGAAWTQALPGLAAHQCDRWGLRPTGAPMHGAVAMVVPVERPDGRHAALKVQPVDAETEGEPAALRAWDGDGAVRLLDHDPGTGALLLESLDPSRNLDLLAVDDALKQIGALLARLSSHPAPPGLRDLRAITLDLVDRAEYLSASRLGPGDQRQRLTGLAAGAREMADEPGDRLLHWDLHYQNVLAPLPGSERDPWLAIDPKPLSGAPGFDLLPALHNRWAEAEATGDVRRETRRRFDLLTEVADLERARARAWTLVRVLQESVWALQDGDTGLPTVPMAVADAVES